MNKQSLFFLLIFLGTKTFFCMHDKPHQKKILPTSVKRAINQYRKKNNKQIKTELLSPNGPQSPVDFVKKIFFNNPDHNEVLIIKKQLHKKNKS